MCANQFQRVTHHHRLHREMYTIHPNSFQKISLNRLTLLLSVLTRMGYSAERRCLHTYSSLPVQKIKVFNSSLIKYLFEGGNWEADTQQHKYIPNQREKFYLSKYSAYTTGSGKICSKNSSPSSPFDFKYSQRTRQYKAISGVNVSNGIDFLYLKGRE